MELIAPPHSEGNVGGARTLQRMTPQLVPLCTVEVTLAAPIVVGLGPSGLRVVIEVEEMTITGDRVRGQLKGHAAADWVTLVDNVASVDVRATIATDDGAIILCEYKGRIDFTNGAGTAPVYVAPLFETGDERYKWLNLVQGVGVGTTTDNGTKLHYEWFELKAPA
jgi:hypothetical protein